MTTATDVTARTGVSWSLLVACGVLGLLAVLFHASIVRPLVTEWYEHENFSYGFLIPFVFAYLVLQRWHMLQREKIAPAIWGTAFLTGSIAVGLIGNALGEPFLSRLSLVATVAALVHVIGGWRIFRLLAFPLAYLLLMVPPPYGIVKQMSFYFKMFDAVVATGALQLIGVPVYRDSYFLNLPGITLEVADVCSGIASLFAMVALGTVYVYFLPARMRAKLAVLASVLIFPLIANLIRIILVGASVYYYGPVMLKAFFHTFTGTFTFLLSLAMLLVVGEWFRRRYPAADQPKQFVTERDDRTELNSKLLSVPALLAAIVLAGGLSVSRAIALPESWQLQGELDAIPKQLGHFRVAPDTWPDPYSDPEADEALSRLYQGPHHGPIEAFIGYRGSQRGADRLRSPKLVFPSRWEYASMDNIQIARRGGRYINATWLLTKKNNSRRVVLFWYQLPGRTLSSDVLYRLELARGLIFYGRTDAVVVRLASELDGSETVDQALERLITFSQQLFPYVQLLLPEK
ncbi:MAG TPA: EpsI family protein [Candidatus Binatia bacterium]